jgi:hypothetical protein
MPLKKRSIAIFGLVFIRRGYRDAGVTVRWRNSGAESFSRVPYLVLGLLGKFHEVPILVAESSRQEQPNRFPAGPGNVFPEQAIKKGVAGNFMNVPRRPSTLARLCRWRVYPVVGKE